MSLRQTEFGCSNRNHPSKFKLKGSWHRIRCSQLPSEGLAEDPSVIILKISQWNWLEREAVSFPTLREIDQKAASIYNATVFIKPQARDLGWEIKYL